MCFMSVFLYAQGKRLLVKGGGETPENTETEALISVKRPIDVRLGSHKGQA